MYISVVHNTRVPRHHALSQLLVRQAAYRPLRQSAGRAVRLISGLDLPVQGLVPALSALELELEAGASRQLADEERAGAGADEAGAGELLRRLSSSCFQLEGRALRDGVTAFLEAELERAGADEAGAASRQLADEERAGAGADEAAEEEPLPLRRLSSSWRQLAGRTERVGLTRLVADEARLQGRRGTRGNGKQTCQYTS